MKPLQLIIFQSCTKCISKRFNNNILFIFIIINNSFTGKPLVKKSNPMSDLVKDISHYLTVTYLGICKYIVPNIKNSVFKYNILYSDTPVNLFQCIL